MVKKRVNRSSVKEEKKQVSEKKITTLQLKTESQIAMDFATKTYKKFNKIIKSIILFGSAAKKNMSTGSDLDIIIVIDDISISWDQELIAWYREELDNILSRNPYPQELHINTIKLSTWWEDLLRGDPVLLNILRNGEALIDFAGFFVPLKFLLIKGKIKATPEAIYTCLQRAPTHIARSKTAELNTIEGVYWSMVDSAHAALIAAGRFPASPETIAEDLQVAFVSNKMLNSKYIDWYKDLFFLHKKISHGQLADIKGVQVDMWQDRAEEFLSVMVELVKKIIS